MGRIEKFSKIMGSKCKFLGAKVKKKFYIGDNFENFRILRRQISILKKFLNGQVETCHLKALTLSLSSPLSPLSSPSLLTILSPPFLSPVKSSSVNPSPSLSSIVVLLSLSLFLSSLLLLSLDPSLSLSSRTNNQEPISQLLSLSRYTH